MSERLVLDKCIYCDNFFVNVEGDYQVCGDAECGCFQIVLNNLDTSTIPTEKFRRVREEIRSWLK